MAEITICSDFGAQNRLGCLFEILLVSWGRPVLMSTPHTTLCVSYSVVSDSLRPHGLQQARYPCPSATPRVYSNSCPLSCWCHPTVSSSVVPISSCPPIPPSLRVFSNESTLRMRWPKYWSYSFSIIPSKEHPGLISFRMDWLHLLAVQGTLKSLLQQHSSKASILWRPKNQDTVVVVVKEAQRSTRQNREPKYKSIQGQITDFWGRSKSSSMVEG